MLEYLSPLVVLSIIAAVGSTFQSNLNKRIDWIETGLNALASNQIEGQMLEFFPRIMDLTLERVQNVYEHLVSTRHREDPVFQQLGNIAERCNQLKRAATTNSRG
jgi:hypothetical protein